MEPTRADTIADEIQSRIFDGSLKNGDRLDENQLAERFAVSRTPIREALQKLALSGLVIHRPRRGVFVHQPGPVELIEMFEVMAELEAACVRLAATRISDAALDELRAANGRCNAAVEARDPDRYYDENEAFHHILYRQSGNGFLESECQRLHRRLRPFRRVQLRLRGRMAQSLQEHEDIVRHLIAGNGNKAATVMRGHINVQGEKFHHLMANLRDGEAG